MKREKQEEEMQEVVIDTTPKRSTQIPMDRGITEVNVAVEASPDMIIESKKGVISIRIRKCIEWSSVIALLFVTLLILVGVFAIAMGLSSYNSKSRSKTMGVPMNLINKLMDSVDTKNINSTFKYLTSVLSIAGTEGDEKLAKYTAELLQDYGFSITVEVYHVYLSYPLERIVEIGTGGTDMQTLRLEEPVIEEDEYTNTENNPTYNAYSADGDVHGRVVYANYGTVEDFQFLNRSGIDVRDKIVLVRYGKIFRGTKVMIAQERGAVGVLIYSDPADDGYVKGNVYPNGNWRPSQAVQRGSCLFIGRYSGDPSTPFAPSLKNATRLPQNQWNTPQIPVQPISSSNAKRIMETLNTLNESIKDEPQFQGFIGGLVDTKYNLGPGTVEIRLKITMNNTITPIWNTIGTLKGQNNKKVIVGNHRDSWGYGAVDPHCSTSSLLETSRILGQFYKDGWKPLNDIVVAFWDAEEFGLIGSTEHVEDHSADLAAQAIAYINSDMSAYGEDFEASGSGSLADLVRWATTLVHHPVHTNITVYDHWLEQNRPPVIDGEKILPTHKLPPFEAMGSGSDYTPFLQHLGVSAIDFGFTGPYGVYHSTYDNYNWMTKFGDPNFQIMGAAAKLLGIFVIALGDSHVLPFNMVEYATTITEFVDDVKVLYNTIKRDAGNNSDVSLEFSALDHSTQFLLSAAIQFQDKVTNSMKQGSKEYIASLNDKMMFLERKFISEGLRGRPWYRHLIYAPGLYGGYRPHTLPGIRDAIESKQWTNAQTEIHRLAGIIYDISQFLLE